MTRRFRAALSLLLAATALSLGSCSKPKEFPYQKLAYHDGGFTDPETGQPFSGIAKDYHKDGSLKAEFPMKKGKFHGTVKEWHPNGKVAAETEFKEGERTGINREWTADGRPFMERVYDHDRIVSEKKY